VVMILLAVKLESKTNVFWYLLTIINN